MEKAKNAGIFGGTFNPPHVGHFLLAKQVKKEFSLDKIIFVPSFLPPHKDAKSVIDAKYREEMLKLLISGDPGFILSEYEIRKKNVSYTIDTVKFFETEFPGTAFYFISGSDAFYYIDRWKESGKLLKLVKFIVFERNGFDRNKINVKYPGAGILWSKGSRINISSSEVRNNIRQGVDSREEVGEAVWKYIEKNNLYKE